MDQVDRLGWAVVSVPLGMFAMSRRAICQRVWPSTLVKLPTAISSVFCGLTEIWRTSVTAAGRELRTPANTLLT